MNRRKAWKTTSRWAAGGLLLALSGGCSFFYDLNANQCERPSDCEALGPAFEDAICVNRVCVLPSGGGGSGNNGGGGSGNSGGTGDTGGGGTGGMGGVPECTTNAECIADHQDQPYICRDNSCVELISDECPLIIPQDTEQWSFLRALQDHDPLIIGGYGTLATTTPRDTLSVLVWEQALKEINEKTLGGPSIDGARRPVLALVCGAENIETSMNHLAVEVGVPGILTALDPPEVLAAFESEAFTAASPLIMHSGSADNRLVTLQDSNLVWHMLGNPRNFAAPIVSLVAEAEALVQARRTAFWNDAANQASRRDDPADPIRVLLVRSDDTVASDIADILMSPVETAEDRPENNLLFNGVPAYDADETTFGDVQIESIQVHPAPDLSALMPEIRRLKPHIIVAVTTGELLSDDDGMLAIEGQWNAPSNPIAAGQIRPFYVAAHRTLGGSSALLGLVRTFRSFEIETRIVGTNFAAATDSVALALRDEYVAEMVVNYNGSPHEDLFVSAENIYDAAYFLAYGMLGTLANDGAPTGARIANAIENRLTPGRDVFNVGRTDADSVVNLLIGMPTNNIKLRGTLGIPRFNFALGTRENDISAWCVEFDSTPAVNNWVRRNDASLFDPDDNVFLSGFSCIPEL